MTVSGMTSFQWSTGSWEVKATDLSMDLSSMISQRSCASVAVNFVALHTWTPLLAKPFFLIPVLQVEIAAIHSASVCGLSPPALMEFAG